MDISIKKLIDDNNYQPALELVLQNLKQHTFKKIWQTEISDILKEEDIRINCLIIGKVGEFDDRIYVGANTNIVLVYSLEGKIIENITIDEGNEIKDIFISDLIDYENKKQLIVVTADDEILFFSSSRGEYIELTTKIISQKAEITSFYTSSLSENNKKIYLGYSNGDVTINTYSDIQSDIPDRQIIPDTEKIPNEKIASICGDDVLYNDNPGIMVAYKNGVLLLFDDQDILISKIDIDKEIEKLCFLKNSGSILISTDDNNIYSFSISGEQLVYNWNFRLDNTISLILPCTTQNSNIDFIVLSEDYGTILHFDKFGNFLYKSDPSFESTAGQFYGDYLYLATRNGELAEFELTKKEYAADLIKVIFELYYILFNEKTENDFYEYFNSELESEESVGYIINFLIEYLGNKPSVLILNKINSLFVKKRYNTDIAEGLISKITSNSRLKTIMLRTFPNSVVFDEISNYEQRIDREIKDTNLFQQAKEILKTDIHKYISLMNELLIMRIDKIWVESIFTDDDVVGIRKYHDPYDLKIYHYLIATRKGKIFLLDNKTGKMIWSFVLDSIDGEITNIEVADICNDGNLEIIIGCKNRYNSILILSLDKEKFASKDNLIKLTWHNEFADTDNFHLYFTRTHVTGIDAYTIVHSVHCFDFDNNGIDDLVISSENGNFNVFYFDKMNRSKIIPRSESISYEDDDVLVFDIVRDNESQAILYTGSASGRINKHIYKDKNFVLTEYSFAERDAKITDLLFTEIDSEKVLIYSSDDNFIYCLTDNLDYMWSFRADDDVRSIGVSKYNNNDYIFAISKDNKLYALDSHGNKKWDYSLFSPLDKLFVDGNYLVIADSDGNIHKLNLVNTKEIDNHLELDLSGKSIDYLKIVESSDTDKYLKIFSVKKILSSNPDEEALSKLLPLLNDSVEQEELVRIQVIKLLSIFLGKQPSFDNKYSNALINALNDYSSDVRLEAIRSLFELASKHEKNNIDIVKSILDITNDEDIWVKEYLASVLRKNSILSESNNWMAILCLFKNNVDEEWILNELSGSIADFLSSTKTYNNTITYLEELFEINLEKDIYERIGDSIKSDFVKNIYDAFYAIFYEDIKLLKRSLESIISSYKRDPAIVTLDNFIDKGFLLVKITEQINLDELINDKILIKYENCFSFNMTGFNKIIDNLNYYVNENNISDKIVFLNYATESIATFLSNISDATLINDRFITLALRNYLLELISKTTRLFMTKVYLDIEMDSRNVILNEDRIADINLNIINKGYNKIEEIDVSIKPSPYFEIITNIGEIGELVKSQSKKIYFKIKPKQIGEIEIMLDINYKGCEIPTSFDENIYISESTHEEWVAIPNPYISGIPLDNDEVFVGREELVQDIVTAIKKDPVFILGHRRMGKTSLIKYVQRNFLNKDPFVAVFISAEKMVFSSMNDFLYSFAEPISYELFTMGIITEEKHEKYAERIRSGGLIEFGSFFTDIMRKMKSLKKIFILIIDEYPIIHEQVSLEKIDSQFITNLRGYMQNNTQEFKMIYSGASSLKYLKSQYSSNIMGVGKSIEVSFLTDSDVKTLISKPLNDKMHIEDSAFRYLMELTNGQPFLVQTILNYLVDKLNKEKKSSIVFKESLDEGINEFLNQAPHLRTDWGVFDGSQENKFISSNYSWSSDEEKIAKSYKQLIITVITDNWKKSKNGLNKLEIFNKIKTGLKDTHIINDTIFEETLNIMSSTGDILKFDNDLYFIKIGLFREWVINRMNFSFEKTLNEIKIILSNIN